MVLAISSDFLVSIISIACTLFLAEFFRIAIATNFGRGEELIRRCCHEFIASFELCSVAYELGIVADTCGALLFGLMLFLIGLWWTIAWDNYETANTFSHIVDWANRRTTTVMTAGIILAQFAGGIVFYNCYLKYLWYFLASSESIHGSKLVDAICDSNIQVHLLLAAIIEGVGMFLLVLLAKYLPGRVGRKFEPLINSLAAAGLVSVALYWTGGYFNPMTATVMQFGCNEVSFLRHTLVYWIAPIVGAFVADQLYEAI